MLHICLIMLLFYVLSDYSTLKIWTLVFFKYCYQDTIKAKNEFVNAQSDLCHHFLSFQLILTLREEFMLCERNMSLRTCKAFWVLSHNFFT